ncbi:scyllo-inositol 2-dehydrogenase (NADP+) [Marchantia polymorpha subsp. ruderalis]|uniref:Oxidoreductase n=2 Tax=Marchantia polymorpha TaxID=3197 RepID=A0AAF6BB03_MARPO|nr:hypothetical protein MARPO_0041s0070 [Marchantia polymorpha]BBN09187.1 hypothetical protein Mp_4g17890 [Marchantia polymorpha subsp. ruderalis]|eukprot:PTQ40175.1 hypothetical protein MARPO_0041s0070 [Marchantia polymorpha]
MGDAIKVALIGYGMAGQVFHAPVIAAVSQFKLAKVLERRTQESPKRYPWVEVVRDLNDILLDKEIQLVVIATPNSSHFHYAYESLRAGKHVVVDKPFTVTSGEARELIELAEKMDVILTVFQNRRWDGDFLTVQNVVDNKLVGRLVEYEAHFDRFRSVPKPNSWREEALEPASGILYDLGSHMIDHAQVLFGTPEMVTADIRKQRDSSDVDDSFEIVLHYPELRAILKASMLVKVPGPRFILHGTKGSFLKSGIDPQEDALKKGGSPSDSGWGETTAEHRGHLVTKLGDLEIDARVETLPGCYQNFYSQLADAIRARKAPMVDPWVGFNTIRILELAKQSSESKCSVKFEV